MRQIEQGIYITDSYPGVVLGALALPHGILMVDSPPNPDDGRAWKAELRNLGRGVGRLMVNLDSHIDRTLGARALDCPVMSHAEVADELEKRPSIFKAQYPETGAEWELCDGLSGLRWRKPSLTFTEQAILEWGEHQVILEHHPGPDPGAIWLIVPEPGVVFIGDAVVADQPPFLEYADIQSWIGALDILLTRQYRNYLIVASRNGLINHQQIREQRTYLRRIHNSMERLNKREAQVEATQKLIPGLLSKMEFPADLRSHFAQRLSHGLARYYTRHYLPPDEEEIL